MNIINKFLPVSVWLFLLVNSVYAQLPSPDTIGTREGKIIVQPVFHGALVLKLGQRTIYVDPYNGIAAYKGLANPDIVLITDIHQDHLDTATLNAINTSAAKLIVPRAVAGKLPAAYRDKMIILNNGENAAEYGISVTAVPMYNLPEEPDSRHTKGRGNGYLIGYGGKRIYISGDTEDIPEMRMLADIDLAFICMNQPFTMTIQQAASAVLGFKPGIVYPYHYRDMNGFSDITAFKKLVTDSNRNIDVRIRDWYGNKPVATSVTRTEHIVYGMVSGAALTMDMYKPAQSNNIGIIVIPGSAFGYAYKDDYNESFLTTNFLNDNMYFGKYARVLAEKGYTLFVINHRLAPRFHHKDIMGDCQRAVQYVRFNATRFGIDPDNIGAFGYSSGATLCAMLGVTDRDMQTGGNGPAGVSGKVQSVVTLAARFDLSDFNKREDSTLQNPVISRVLFNYVGELPATENGNYVLTGKYAEASPVNYVDKGDASFLIYCSVDDPLVPQRQGKNMLNQLVRNGVAAKLNLSDHGGHQPIPVIEEIDQWFLTHLKKAKQ